jgi:hypothetical protein
MIKRDTPFLFLYIHTVTRARIEKEEPSVVKEQELLFYMISNFTLIESMTPVHKCFPENRLNLTESHS